MKITILGSGTGVPQLSRSACAVLVETGNLKLLLDLGPGTMRRLLESGVSIFEVTHVLFSHFHPDHTAELVPLLFATKYPDADPRKKPLHLLAGVGLNRFYQGLQAAYGEWIVLPQDQLTLREIDTLSGETWSFENVRLAARPVHHRPESLAYRIEDADGFCMVYSGDTDECDGLYEAAREADLFICEASFPDERKISGHLTPYLAGRIAAKAGVKQLVLTHFYPSCEGMDIVKQAARAYKGPITRAEDLMTFVFR